VREEMTETSKTKRPIGICLILVWMALNLLLFIIMIPGDSTDINNYIEVILWVASIGWLATMKKAGGAFAVAVLCITLGTSMFNVLLGYYTNTLGELFVYVNALRIA
jgi:hypothetical protein